MEVLLECCLKIALERAIEVLTDHPHVIRAATGAARRIVIFVLYGMGGI